MHAGELPVVTRYQESRSHHQATKLHLENGRFGWEREGGGGCVSSEKAEQMLKREKLLRTKEI
jgi:hypothetical protein